MKCPKCENGTMVEYTESGARMLRCRRCGHSEVITNLEKDKAPELRGHKTKNATKRVVDGYIGCFRHDGAHAFHIHREKRFLKPTILTWRASCGEVLSLAEMNENSMLLGYMRGTEYDRSPPPPTPMERIATALEAQQAKPAVVKEREIHEVVLVICPYCGHKNPVSSTSCSQCGGNL